MGDAAIISGAVLASREQSKEAGLAVLGAGLLSKVISSATTPAADTRAWDNLPQFLSFAAVKLPPGRYKITVEFCNASGLPDSRFNKTVEFTVNSPPRDTVVFVSDQSITPMSL